MTPHRTKLLKLTERFIPIGIGIGVLAIGVSWGLYFYFNQAEEDNPASQRRYIWLAMALVVTVAAPPLLYLHFRNVLRLLRHGCETNGWVVSVSVVSKRGVRPVTYAYRVAGVEHRLKRDTAGLYADHYQAGSVVTILYDPHRPKSAMILDPSPNDLGDGRG